MSASRLMARAAAKFQRAAVIPHCGSCLRPCCRLETLVLELDWPRLKALWGIEGSRRAFDRRLAAGEGPPEIRSQGGLYYAYRRVCPAFSAATGRCGVYGSRLMPAGCTDFPLYEDDGRLVADLRCEALDLDEVGAFLREELGAEVCLEESADPDFPFLVSFRLGRVRRAGPG